MTQKEFQLETYKLVIKSKAAETFNLTTFIFCRELLLDESITRQSTCELECDVVAPDILNRQDVDG